MPLDLNDPFRFSFNPGDDSYAVSGFEPETVTDFTRGRYRFNGAWGVFSDLTFARASTATYVDSTGTLQTASSGEARRGHHEWDGSKWVNKGLLLESEARTNLLTHSRDLSNAAWQTFGTAPVTVDQAIGLGGTAYMDELGGNGNGNGKFQSFAAAASSTYCVSQVLKYNTATTMRFIMRDQPTAADNIFTDITLSASGVTISATAANGAFTLGGSGVIPLGNGLYRVWMAGTTGPATTNCKFEIQVSNPSGSGTVFIGDMQAELGSLPSSIIPTTGATATRAAETLRIPAAKMAYDSTAMSMQMAGEMTYADRNTAPEVSMLRWVVSSGNVIRAYTNTIGARTGQQFFLQEVGSVQDILSSDENYYSPGLNVPFNIASRHGATFINGALDGTALTADTTPTALPDLSAVDLELGLNFMGTIATFRQWAADLGDAGIAEASA